MNRRGVVLAIASLAFFGFAFEKLEAQSQSCSSQSVSKQLLLGCGNNEKQTKYDFHGDKACFLCLYQDQGCETIKNETACWRRHEQADGTFCYWADDRCATQTEEACDRKHNGILLPGSLYIKKPYPEWTLERLFANPPDDLRVCGPTTIMEARHGIGPECIPERVRVITDHCSSQTNVVNLIQDSCSDGRLAPQMVQRIFDLVATEYKMPQTPEIRVTANQCPAKEKGSEGAPIGFYLSHGGCELSLPECGMVTDCIDEAENQVAYCDNKGSPACMKCAHGSWVVMENDLECRNQLVSFPAGARLHKSCFSVADLMTDFACHGSCTCTATRKIRDWTPYLKVWRVRKPGPTDADVVVQKAINQENAESTFIDGLDCQTLCRASAPADATEIGSEKPSAICKTGSNR